MGVGEGGHIKRLGLSSLADLAFEDENIRQEQG